MLMKAVLQWGSRDEVADGGACRTRSTAVETSEYVNEINKHIYR